MSFIAFTVGVSVFTTLVILTARVIVVIVLAMVVANFSFLGVGGFQINRIHDLGKPRLLGRRGRAARVGGIANDKHGTVTILKVYTQEYLLGDQYGVYVPVVGRCFVPRVLHSMHAAIDSLTWVS